jgi:uncharacterized protein YndB with AHSA1/START domain
MGESRRRSGFLVLADISGYTAFLTGTELEHAQGIIEDLTRTILGSLTPALTLVKLEGDAVFAHAPEGRLSGDRILDLVERTYWEFADCREDMQRNTTCTCEACANIPSLDLKFLVHYGEYLTHSVSGVEDLAGPDVILIHRLLKNTVRETTGCGAYALLTERALATARGLQLTEHTEEAEGFGRVRGGVLDLRESLTRMRETRRVFIEEGESDFTYTMHLPLSPAEAWAWWTDPALFPLWHADTESQRLERNQTGRHGTESVMHCAHGSYDTVARYLDWRPFFYYTAERLPSRRTFFAPPPLVETLELRPREDGGTDTTYRMRMHDRSRRERLRMRLVRPLARREFAGYERALIKLLADRAAAKDEDAAPAAEG